MSGQHRGFREGLYLREVLLMSRLISPGLTSVSTEMSASRHTHNRSCRSGFNGRRPWSCGNRLPGRMGWCLTRHGC